MIRLNVINRGEHTRCKPGITFNQDNLFYRIDCYICMSICFQYVLFSFFIIDFEDIRDGKKKENGGVISKIGNFL